MATLLSLLVVLASLANLVLFILVLIKLFQKEGTLKGILGLICSLYTFIWGWIKHKELQITNIMIGWTACIIITIILQLMAQAALMSQIQ